MDEVWCGLDLQLQASDIAGGLHHRAAAAAAADDDPFWPALADCAASFLAGDSFADDVDLTGSSGSHRAVGDGDMVMSMDTAGFFVGGGDGHLDDLMMPQAEPQQQPVYSSSSLSSKRSLSIDSGGSSSAFFPLDDAALQLAAAAGGMAAGVFPPSASLPSAAAPLDPFAANDDDAIMRAMMAVLSSSASPSSSESSSPQLSQDTMATTTAQAQAAVQPQPRGHVTVRSSSAAAAPPERTTSQTSRQLEDARAAAAAAGSNNNSSQVYHMMSERKRREKLNDSFHTLRSLLPPCSKKDKTTVLINAASHLKALEAEVSGLEETNARLERYVPREGTAAAAAHHRRAKVQISRAAADERQVSLTVMVMVMVECDIVELVLRVLERLRLMRGVSVVSVDADTYSPQALLKALANIKLHVAREEGGGDCWDEAVLHEAMTKAVNDATSSSPYPSAPLVAAA